MGNDVPLGGVDASDSADAMPGADGLTNADAAPLGDAGPAAWATAMIFDTLLFTDVWGAAPNDVWAATRSGQIAHWNGTLWSSNVAPNANAAFNSLWGTATNNVWMVGVDTGVPQLYRFNGTNWVADATPADLDLTGVTGKPDGTAWTVGYAFNFQRYDPSPTDDWIQQTGMDLIYWPETVFASPDTDDLWIAGMQGIFRWKQSDNTYTGESVTGVINSVWGQAGNDVWAVGQGGVIQHWNGSAWSDSTSNTTENLHDVWASGPNDAWAVGDAGTILHWDGVDWTAVTDSPTVENLQGIHGFGPQDIYAVGNDSAGVIIHYGPQ